jgi:hypothetical protein
MKIHPSVVENPVWAMPNAVAGDSGGSDWIADDADVAIVDARTTGGDTSGATGL